MKIKQTINIALVSEIMWYILYSIILYWNKFYTVYQTLYENTVIYMRIGKLKVFPSLSLKKISNVYA